MTDPRTARRAPSSIADEAAAGALPSASSPATASNAPEAAEATARRAYREDLERIRFSPYYSRLAAVTQVISQNGAGQGVHNRLTHTIKVTSVARAIAVSITEPSDPRAAIMAKLGGCDRVVVQAAAS